MRRHRPIALVVAAVITVSLIGGTPSGADIPEVVPGTGGFENALTDVAVRRAGSADRVVFTFAGDTVPTVDATFDAPPIRDFPGNIVEIPGQAFVRLRMFPAAGASFGETCANALGPGPRAGAGQVTVSAYFTCSQGLIVTEPVVPSGRVVRDGSQSAVLAATIRELLAGPDADDAAAGLVSFFSDATADQLRSASVAPGGRATIDFEPSLTSIIPGASSSAGSGAFLREIDATVFQFTDVTSATYALGGSCQAFYDFLQIGECLVRTPRDGSSATFSVTYPGPDTVTGPSENVTQVSETEDFEAQLVWVLGMRTLTDVSITTATGPSRIIVTVPHDPEGSRSRIYVSNRVASGPAAYAFLFAPPDQPVITGDWDGSGFDGFGTRSGNTFTLADRVGNARRMVGYGKAGDEVFVGDWDGNGTDTLAVRRGNVFFLRNRPGTGKADRLMGYGRAGDEVFVGDWDGNGTDTLAVRRGNVFYLRNSLRSGVAQLIVTYGRPGDEVFVGDWDGNGTDTFAVRRGNTIYIRDTLRSGPAQTTIGYGTATDQLLVGDFDADRIDTFAARRGPP